MRFAHLDDSCTMCGAGLEDESTHVICTACNVVRYCCTQHRDAAARVHRLSCGRPLPSQSSIASASLQEVVHILKEYGTGHAAVADAALERLVKLIEAIGTERRLLDG